MTVAANMEVTVMRQKLNSNTHSANTSNRSPPQPLQLAQATYPHTKQTSML